MSVWSTMGTSVLFAILLIVAACAPAAQPTPGAAPTKAAPVAKSGEATPIAAKPATAAPKPAPVSDWKVEWDKVVAVAKKEGKVVVMGPPGDTWRRAMGGFQKAFPEIILEYQGLRATDAVPKVLAERKGGLYLWDVFVGGGPLMVEALPQNKAVIPLRNALILPEVLDSTKWHQGFDDGWLDEFREYVYGPLGYLTPTAHVNREVAPAAELRRIDDLLDPRWKGKIVWHDPREPGPGQGRLRHLYFVKGEAWLRKLLAQDIDPIRDSRLALEGLVRGRYAVLIGMRTGDEREFEQAGLMRRIETLDFASPEGAGLTGGEGSVGLADQAPNPNAAKVFTNWLLSREGQEAGVAALQLNSRRLDVAGPPETAPITGIKYVNNSAVGFLHEVEHVPAIAKEILR